MLIDDNAFFVLLSVDFRRLKWRFTKGKLLINAKVHQDDSPLNKLAKNCKGPRWMFPVTLLGHRVYRLM